MGALLNRYRGGDHIAVWKELAALGAGAREEPLFSEAQAVAAETMVRARSNIETIVRRLGEIGYQFGVLEGWNSGGWLGDHQPVYEPPQPDAREIIDRLEAQFGPMPLSLRAWYENVGAVNLLGLHPDWPKGGLDALCSIPLPDVAQEIEECYVDYKEQLGSDAPYKIPFAPDRLHKDDVSGGAPYGIIFPSPAADAPLLNEVHGASFTGYLRICFRWGGFPGLERHFASPLRDEHLDYLTTGLLPL